MQTGGRTEATDAVERAMTADGAAVRLRDKHVARMGADGATEPAGEEAAAETSEREKTRASG